MQSSLTPYVVVEFDQSLLTSLSLPNENRKSGEKSQKSETLKIVMRSPCNLHTAVYNMTIESAVGQWLGLFSARLRTIFSKSA